MILTICFSDRVYVIWIPERTMVLVMLERVMLVTEQEEEEEEKAGKEERAYTPVYIII